MFVARRARWFALFLVLIVSAACHGKRTGDVAEQERATLHVTNDHWSDINVFLMRNGARFRLGTVTTAMTRHFVLPVEATIGASDIRLVADPIGSRRTYTSPSIHVGAGEQVVWRVANHMSLSTLRVTRGAF